MLVFLSDQQPSSISDDSSSVQDVHSTPDKLVKKDGQESIQSTYPNFYAAYQLFKNQTEDDEKLSAIKKAVETAKQEQFRDPIILQSLHLKAAEIYQNRWHFVFAIESLKAAQEQRYEQRITRHIKQLRKHLQQVEAERGLNDSYIATKYSGPAKQLKGRVLVTYVYVDDGLKTRWSNKSRHRTEQVLELVQQWQTSKAITYGVNNIEFINRTFVARRNPLLRTSGHISFESDGKQIERYVTSIMNSLGEKNIGSFIENQLVLVGADQGVVILHTNFDQRSFAQRCGYTHKQQIVKNGQYETRYISQCNNEYVMLMEQVKRNRWDKMHYAQAHEMMHVFGAADLYNIKNAKDFSVTDIMNFQSKQLEYSAVDPITAYAIGWLDRPPKAPFKILEK
jgi:hypothetical protein